MKRLITAALMVLATVRAIAQTSPQPRVFEPGLISDGSYTTSAEFTPDGNTVYFLRGSPDFSYWTIYESHKLKGQWSKPIVASFSGEYSDADPCVTADNKHLFFVSQRP